MSTRFPIRAAASLSLLAAAIAPAQSVTQTLSNAAESFVENRGQWDAQAQFLARSPGMDVWVTQTGMVYDFHLTDRDPKGIHDPLQKAAPGNGTRKGHVVRMEFANSNFTDFRGVGPQEGTTNYFIGSDRSRWASGVPRFAAVRQDNLYKGIDLVWYFDRHRPRYDLAVAPGADPSAISLKVHGAQAVTASGKTLGISTQLGTVELRGLFAYQRTAEGVQQVPCTFKQRGGAIGFELGSYDRTLPLVIDPILWSTYLGGSGAEEVLSVALDSNGRAIAAGWTSSNDLPTTVGAYQSALAAGIDAFVAKLSASGQGISFLTYLGGNDQDMIQTVAIDPNNNVAVAGSAFSTDFPTTLGAADTTHNGSQDAFVAKLATNGQSLIFSTYLGGSGSDQAYDIEFDSFQNLFVVGTTNSWNFPTTVGASQTTYGTNGDGFVTRVLADGSSFLASTYFGGASGESITGVAITSGDEPMIAGSVFAFSGPNPVVGGIQPNLGSVILKAFVTKFNTALTSRADPLIFGGTGGESVTGIALHDASAYIVGSTSSADFPATVGSFNKTYAGDQDCFVAKIDPNTLAVLAATLFGGVGTDSPRGIAVDAAGNVLLVGQTFSSDYPTTSAAYDRTVNAKDGFVSKLNSDLSKLLYSSYLGGTANDVLYSLALDSSGNALFGGSTESSDFPVTAGVVDQTQASTEGVLVRFLTAPTLIDASVPKASFIGGFSVPLTLLFNQIAEPNDLLVPLSTDTPSKVLIGASTKLKKGKSSKNTGIRTETVKTSTPVQVSATLNGVTKTVAFTLEPGGLLSVKASPSTLTELSFGTGTVLLSAPAPAGGRQVALWSSRPDVLFVPVAVGVTQGFANAIFPVYAGPTTLSTPVTITASLGTMKKTASLTVVP